MGSAAPRIAAPASPAADGRVHLSAAERERVDALRRQGIHRAQVINRAHILACLDRGVAPAQVQAVLGVAREAVMRTLGAYLRGGVELALFDLAEPADPAAAAPPAPGGGQRSDASSPPPGRLARVSRASCSSATR